MVRALALLYEATGGGAWRNNLKWLSGEPCVDGWFGVHCCPQALPVLRGDDECTADGGGGKAASERVAREVELLQKGQLAERAVE